MPRGNDLPRIELRGHQLDLENLATALGSGDHRLSCDRGMYWLHSTDFDELAGDPDTLRAKAAELLPLINGAAKASLPGFHPVQLGQCVDWVAPDGRAKRRLSDTFTLHARSSERVAVQGENAALTREIAEWTSIARGDERVADVLRLWGSSRLHDWDMLYKLKEMVEAAAGSQFVRRWATNAELRRFDHTANSPAVIGNAARHGVQTSDPPASPMSINEAQDLVERLVRGLIGELRINR